MQTESGRVPGPESKDRPRYRMSVRIRLRRVGRKKQPYYRVVVMNSTASRDSAYIDEVGFYNPRTEPASLKMDLEKVDQWIAKGAELTDSAASLIRKARNGGDASVRVVKPGEEAPVKTSRMPERRPTSKPVTETPEAEAEAPAAEAGAEPTAETIAKAEPQVDAKAEPEVEVESGVVATPANEEKAEPAKGKATEEASAAADEAPAAEAATEEPAAEAEAGEPAAEAEEPAAEAEAKPKKKSSKKKSADEASEE